MANIPHIGLLPQGGKNWIAGVIYIQNIIRALGRLPEEQRPRLSMVVHLMEERSIPGEILSEFPEFLYYVYDQKTPLINKLRMVKWSIKTRRFPVSLESLVIKNRFKALFPAQSNLGRDFPVPWVGWVPDFQHKRLPEYFTLEDIKVRDQSYSAIIKEATHVVVSSQDAYNDLMEFFPADKARVSILRFSSVLDDDWFETNPTAIVAQYKLPEKFLIFPSQFWAHKNHRIVFEALKILKNKGMGHIKVVFTGQNSDYRRPAHFSQLMALKSQYAIEDQVIYLGLLERQKQIQLMRSAAAVLQPSFFEGWSALVEDARALGKRIYLSDIPVHREQNPANAVFFDPNNAQELAGFIQRDFDKLPAGPDKEQEKTARLDARENTLAFAKEFLNMINCASDQKQGRTK